jgi:hypothetical protein
MLAVAGKLDATIRPKDSARKDTTLYPVKRILLQTSPSNTLSAESSETTAASFAISEPNSSSAPE